MSNFLIFKAAFNNSATPAIGTYTAEGATAQFNNDPGVSPDYYLYNTAAGSTAVQWFVPTAETTDFEFVADILTDDQSLDGDRYFIIADSTGTTGLCMLSSSSITEWRFMNGDGTATSDPEYVGAIDPATSGGFGVFHQFRVRVRKLTASSSSVEVYVDGALKLTATAGAALVTCAKIGFIGGVTGSPSTSAGIKNAYVYDLSGGELVDRGVLSEAFNRYIDWSKGVFIPLAGSNQISGSLIPATTDAYDLGGSSYQWNNAYIKSLTINGVACGDILTHNASEFVPRSGGAVMTSWLLARSSGGDALTLCGGTGTKNGASVAVFSTGYPSDGLSGSIRFGLQSYAHNMYLKANGTWTWDGSAVQLVSDQRLKQQIAEIDDKLLDAWKDVAPVQFKYNDSVNEKGDKARLHTGYVVQQIDSACKSHNVDISQYGLYCHEEYPEETEEVEVEQEDGTKTKETKVIREASEHYSLRYTEVYAVECMYLRRCIKQLTARIEQLTTRIEQLEKGKEREAGK